MGQRELSSPPRAVCPSVWPGFLGPRPAAGALLPTAAVAQAENHVKSGGVSAVPLPSLFPHSPLGFAFFFFWTKTPHLSPFREPEGEVTPTPHGSFQPGTRHRLLPGYQGPADAKPHSGLLFAKP